MSVMQDRLDRSCVYRLSHHARTQANLKGISERRVLEAARNPHHTYPSLNHPGQFRHVRDGVVAIIDPRTLLVITIYVDQVQTPLRLDQVHG